jgi:hypothetical protein
LKKKGRTRMRVRVAGLAVLALLLSLFVATTTDAAGPKRTAAQCKLKVNVTLSPGISLTATSGTFTGSGGTINCSGTVFGKVVNATQTGSLSISGSYGPDTCASGKGRGTFSASIGGKSVRGSFTYTRAGATGTFTGTATDGLGSTATIGGGFLFQPPTNQNCVKVRVTKATVTGSAALEG